MNTSQPLLNGRSRLAAFIVFALLVAGGGLAFADADRLPQPAVPAAKTHFDAGNNAFDKATAEADPASKQTLFRVAIKEYLAGVAVETKFHYTFYWNVAQAYRQLGEYTRAQFFYKKFLDFAPERFAAYRTAAEDFRRMMQAELDKESVAAAAEARKSTDDGAAQPRGDASVAVRPVGPPTQEPIDVVASPRWYSDTMGWTLVGVGLGGTVVGGGLLQNSSSLFDQAADEDRQSVKADLEDRARTRRAIGGVAGGLGLACLAVGVIKLAVTPPSRPNSPSVHVTVGPSSFSIQGSF